MIVLGNPGYDFLEYAFRDQDQTEDFLQFVEDEGLVNKLIIKILRLFLVEIPNSTSEELDVEKFG